jgi:aryl-alcohol dehydrogenase-like predicted oxidoreductase
MKYIELTPGISSSALGFGCAPILGAVDKKKSTEAILSALDCGINHFDLARSYGYGEAEYFIGKLLKHKRDKIVIATKFGIKANWKANILKPLKPVVRFLKDKKNDLNKSLDLSSPISIQRTSDFFHDRIKISPKNMRTSLENSLRALNTDHIDYYFIHEPLERIGNIDELLNESYSLKKEGKIRALGLAYYQSQKSLHQDYLSVFDVLQFNNSPGTKDYLVLKEDFKERPCIFFSPLKSNAKGLTHSEKLLSLHQDFSQSISLVSMFTKEHLLSNVKLFS